MARPHILVIKLSAFGDFCVALSAFEAIRAHHRDAHITLITTAPFADMARQSPYFDEVQTLARWRAYQLPAWIAQARAFWRKPFHLVYDLQSNDRTRILKRLSPAIMRHNWYFLRQPDQRPAAALNLSRFTGLPPTDMSWLTQHATCAIPSTPYVLLVPGCAPQHTVKRWPAAYYATLAQHLVTQGVTPVLLGTTAESDATAVIAAACPAAIDLTGQTRFADIAALAQHAAGAVGNDTGPMHLIALCGCPVVSLFSHASDPQKSAPRGAHVRVLRAHPIADIAVGDVMSAFAQVIRRP